MSFQWAGRPRPLSAAHTVQSFVEQIGSFVNPKLDKKPLSHVKCPLLSCANVGDDAHSWIIRYARRQALPDLAPLVSPRH